MTFPAIAALYVQKDGAYFGDPSIDPWDERRDARFYAGPHPVIAHPPCQRWCRLAGLVEKRWGYKRGDDGGTFAHALYAVRTFGGVLEHPAYSDDSTVQASWCGNVRGPDGKHVPRRAVVGEGVTSGRERVTKKQASATPPAFRAELLALVRSIPVARISAPR